MGLYQRHLQPRLLDVAMGSAAVASVRRRVCAGLRGDVLEIGHGSGRNQPFLPEEVSGVWAVEPSALALRLGEGRRAASRIPVVVAADDAQELPFDDDVFDAALCTWSLCGIASGEAALREVARVLRPGGALHFVEHGLSPEASVARWQRRGSAVNRVVAGCRLDRDVAALLAQSPLTVTALDSWYEPGAPRPVGWMTAGRATA